MIIFATGTEVSLALNTAETLLANHMVCRVVSVPYGVFAQDQAYQQAVLSQHILSVSPLRQVLQLYGRYLLVSRV